MPVIVKLPVTLQLLALLQLHASMVLCLKFIEYLINPRIPFNTSVWERVL